MRMRPIIYIAIGFGLLFLAHEVGLMGDAAPLVPGGVSAERAKYHLIALVIDLGAIALFIAAIVSMIRGRRS
jgi:hypothetical protein